MASTAKEVAPRLHRDQNSDFLPRPRPMASKQPDCCHLQLHSPNGRSQAQPEEGGWRFPPTWGGEGGRELCLASLGFCLPKRSSRITLTREASPLKGPKVILFFTKRGLLTKSEVRSWPIQHTLFFPLKNAHSPPHI